MLVTHFRRSAHGALLLALVAMSAPALGAAAPTYVGAATCAECHAQESALWKASHHAQAMLPPTAETVRGNFAGATFTKDGVTSTFFRRDGGWFVRTDGPDGQRHDYRVAYTFGVDPLQQYLIEMPGGRLQALGIAWDTRPAAQGGQRWFHLYPNERLDQRDPLHWTGAQQNWNFMCADCHSTNLHKRYRADEDRFATTWSEVNVACEACHGPGAAHVAWARAGGPPGDPRHGLAVALGDGGAWTIAPGQSTARRSAPRASDLEVETCGRCHARAARLRDDYVHGRPLADTHRVTLLDPGLYHADGQFEDEVYEYGSFLQSPMHAAGVTCSDCHDPHGGQLRAEGNRLCARCHLPATFDTPAHTHHAAGSAAAQCVSCHMPERIYMVIDGRRDHSFRVPRPDLSVRLGTPNACTGCHTDRSAQWAADAAAGWYGPARAARWHYAEALAAGRAQSADAEAQLVRAIGDPSVPPIARATALALLAPVLSPRSLPAVQAAARDADPLVRRAAAQAAAGLPPAERLGTALPLLDDPVRTVRLEALDGVLDAPPSALTPAQRDAVMRAVAEYRQVQADTAERAESRVNLGMLEARLGNAAAAQAAFAGAIRLDARFSPAYVGLADLQRRSGREADAEATLRAGLQAVPDAADLHAALGFALVRQKRLADALPALHRAAELAPDDPHFAYVYAIALHDSGDRAGAIATLTRAHERRPAAREIVAALVQYEAEAGNQAAAAAWAQKLR